MSAEVAGETWVLLRVFTLSVRPPNLANGRMHWARRASLVAQHRQLARLVGGSEMAKHGIGRADGKRRVVMTAEIVGVPMDPDNLAANMKPFLDGLRDCGLIVDDSPKWCELEVRQSRVATRAAQRVWVELWRRAPDTGPLL